MKTWTTSSGTTIQRILSGRCNCHLIRGEKGFLLVDCGGKRQWNRLSTRLMRFGVGAAAPLTLVLTHSHFDHAENAAALKREFNAVIMVHESEADNLEQGENPAIRGANPFFRFLVRAGERSGIMARMGYAGTPADLLVGNHFDLQPQGFPATIIHTRGHTHGSMSVVVDNEIALVGDSVFGIFPGSAFPPFAVDPEQLARSWEKLLDTNCVLFLPGHGHPRSRYLLQQQLKKHSKAQWK